MTADRGGMTALAFQSISYLSNK